MSGARVTIDGLWRCLCPSIDAATLATVISVPHRHRLAGRCPAGDRTCAGPRATTRALHTTRRRLRGGTEADPFSKLLDLEAHKKRDVVAKTNDSWEASLSRLGTAEDGRQQDRSSDTDGLQDGLNRSENPLSAPAQELGKNEAGSPAKTSGPTTPWDAWRLNLPKKVRGTIVERLMEMRPPYAHFPPGVTDADLVEALRNTRQRGKPKWRRLTAALVKRLLNTGNPPMTFIYETLLMAHALPEGSADVVKSLLEEMRTKKIPWSQTAYHSAIRALAMHPDYLLRNDVIREMKERWVDILPKGHRYIALGLLRDEQYELALEKLEEMIRGGILVEPWVFDIFIYVFGKLEFLDDALRIARHRIDRGFQVPVNIWYFLLDVCSKGQNHEATTYIWNRTVQQGIVNPSDGVALNVLNMAAAYGDTELATQVIQYIAARGTRLSRPHYEALADAYSVQGKVDRAIEVYCIMYDAGAEVSHSTAGSLCQAFTRDPSLLDTAVQAMSELKQKYKVPIGVFNAVLKETARSNAQSPDEAFDKALGLYRRVREFVPAGPNLQTFGYLLWKCTRPDVAQFLASEMVAFKVRQNLVIRELMFRVHVEHHGPTHRVKEYFFKIAPHLRGDYEPGSWRWRHIMDLSVNLVKRLIANRDPEAWRVLDICKQNGLEEDRIKALREEVEAGKITMADGAGHPVPGQEAGFRSMEDTPAAGL